jgi:hypothetical protein
MKEGTQLYYHRRLDTDEVFYVGIGEPGRAYQAGRGRRSVYWNRIAKKYGYRVEILEEGLSWYQACELEKMLIALHGRQDLGYGPLVNMTDGGDGTPGIKRSDAWRSGQSINSKDQWFNPDIREYMIMGMQTAWTEDRRANQSKRLNELWTEEKRIKASSDQKEIWTEEKNAAHSALMKEVWKDPEKRKRRSEAAKLMWEKRKQKTN